MFLVNVPILGRRFGDIVKEGDKDFSAFSSWAKNSDLKCGVLICQPVERVAEDNEDDNATDSGGAVIDEENTEESLSGLPASDELGDNDKLDSRGLVKKPGRKNKKK